MKNKILSVIIISLLTLSLPMMSFGSTDAITVKAVPKILTATFITDYNGYYETYNTGCFITYNINGYNYVKLRDMSDLLAGLPCSFDVGYENGMVIVKRFKFFGDEIELPYDMPDYEYTATAIPSTVNINIREYDYDFNAILKYNAYNINGNNYIKIVDVLDITGGAWRVEKYSDFAVHFMLAV